MLLLTRRNLIRSLGLLAILSAGAIFAALHHPQPALAPDPGRLTEALPDETTLFFAGDIMLSRHVAEKMFAANDFNLPFEKVADWISQADISFANLESPFSDQGPRLPEGLVFKAQPQAAAGLTYAGFEVLSTANNHSFDQDEYGIDYTLRLLQNHGILPVGTEPTDGSILPPAVITKNQTRFGFLAYSYAAHNDGGAIPSPYVADFNDIPAMVQAVKTMKAQEADVVIVSMHAGTEYTANPTPAQVAFAHAAIDAGADLVIGAHPHWIQTIEQYKHKWIFYSLGNFIFDQMWSEPTRQGLTLLATYRGRELQKIELRPVIIDDYCCARPATADERRAILSGLGLTSPILVDNN
jgi:poly-gamma-glutamate synthesis protein (capsule biosynthesis protein)